MVWQWRRASFTWRWWGGRSVIVWIVLGIVLVVTKMLILIVPYMVIIWERTILTGDKVYGLPIWADILDFTNCLCSCGDLKYKKSGVSVAFTGYSKNKWISHDFITFRNRPKSVWKRIPKSWGYYKPPLIFVVLPSLQQSRTHFHIVNPTLH